MLDPSDGECQGIVNSDFSGFISLRAMSLEFVRIQARPVSVGRLKHLRGVAQIFTSLEELELHNMPQLEEWSLVKENVGGQAIQLPSLRKFSIERCPKLMRLPLSLSLEDLVLRDCKESLHIQFIEKLRSLPPELDNLSKLTALEVRDCVELLSLPEGLEKLSLKFITIAFCGNLNSFPDVGSSLINLSILSCPSLTTLPNWLRYQTSLQELFISDCPMVEISKVEFHNLISLRSLTMWGFPELTSLPEGIHHVSTLRKLRIVYCKNFRTLPGWMQHLTSLQTLDLEGCHPDLFLQCKKASGEDWQHIAHIPRLVLERFRTPIAFQVSNNLL
ncbi:hypothetical protein FRX31_002689 [Thalictrum thalictroides]|uniref:Disease resistance protein rga2 n=1 Tax=Thalictrum thalictroides TaxID=46969 RepID=A0A7J6XE06_THATH|nr:hypothetical protein FRX31_002689 [Thalictrum thalictroides]